MSQRGAGPLRGARDDTTSSHAPEVVVIGGGFAGINAVRALANHDVHVTIVDQRNFHTFLPLLYQVATAGLEPADVAYPIRTIFGRNANVAFRHGRATSVDMAQRVVRLGDGSALPFDHLIVACGAKAAFFDIPGAEAHAMPLYTLGDARRLRDHLLLTLEAVDATGHSDAGPLTFVIVGGGPTGVETAGAILELLEVCQRRDGMRLDAAGIRVVLLDTASTVLGAFPSSASAYARRTLARRGVEVRLGESVTEVTATGVTLASGERIPSSTVVWAAGVSARGTLADALGTAADSGGRIAVAADLSVVGLDGVWAAGDGAAVPSGRSDAICPQLAAVAIQSGRHCGRQILNAIEGRPTEPFRYRNKGIMATIGRRAAVAKLPGAPVITGVPGWLAWMALHLFYLVGFRNRILVFVNWTWRYFDWPSGPRLIMADVASSD